MFTFSKYCKFSDKNAKLLKIKMVAFEVEIPASIVASLHALMDAHQSGKINFVRNICLTKFLSIYLVLKLFFSISFSIFYEEIGENKSWNRKVWGGEMMIIQTPPVGGYSVKFTPPNKSHFDQGCDLIIIIILVSYLSYLLSVLWFYGFLDKNAVNFFIRK